MAQSPFLPDSTLQFAYDATSLSALKRCPRLYQYSIIEGWRSKKQSLHLIFGGVYHAALELYDKLTLAEGLASEPALLQVVAFALRETWIDGAPWNSEDTSKNRETLIRSIIWYLDQFGTADPAQTVVLANGKVAVELSFSMESDIIAPNGEPYLLCGHLDRIVNFAGFTYVMDRKTTGSTLGSYYFDNYHPDNQMSLYSIAAQTIFNSPVKGVLIDAAQIAVGFTRFERGVTYRSRDQLDEWLHDTEVTIRLAEGYASQHYYPMNDTACFNCAFRRICSLAPAVRQTYLESDFVKRHWNPLEPR